MSEEIKRSDAPAPAPAPTPASEPEVIADDDDDIDAIEPGEPDGADDESHPSRALEPDPDLEEVDWNGKKLKVHRELKPALMMQADYTKKTQEVAERRRALEAEYSQQAEAAQEAIVKQGELSYADKMIRAYEQLNWAELEGYDRQHGTNEAQTRLREQMEWARLRDNLSRDVTKFDTDRAEKAKARQLETEQTTANRREEARQALHRDIPQWSDVGPKVAEFAVRELGYTRDELYSMDDPRLGKALHRAFVGSQIAEKQKAAVKTRAAQVVPIADAPLAQVTGRAGGPATGKSLEKADMDSYVALRKAGRKT